MSEIKDVNSGSVVRINGNIYRVIKIEKSPWILGNKIDQYILTLEYIEFDLGEKLADIVELGK